MSRERTKGIAGPLFALIVLQTGCSTMLQDARVSPPAQARHCEGSESITSTKMAVLPVPLVAFFTPRVSFNSPDSGAILNKCGGKQQVNRDVQANYAMCAPTIFLTTIMTLGIAGVCPTFVSYKADVVD